MVNGDRYGCSAYLGNENFWIDNLNKIGFKDLLEGKGRKLIFDYIDKM